MISLLQISTLDEEHLYLLQLAEITTFTSNKIQWYNLPE